MKKQNVLVVGLVVIVLVFVVVGYFIHHGNGPTPEAAKPAVVEKVEMTKSVNQTNANQGKEVAKDKGIRNEETRKALREIGFNPDQVFGVRAEVGGR